MSNHKKHKIIPESGFTQLRTGTLSQKNTGLVIDTFTQATERNKTEGHEPMTEHLTLHPFHWSKWIMITTIIFI